ncbi:hypothetical protein T484DRAFT_1945433 [Baffinella frigidus]|nr:hypothetical protein T484DRAFT_1945433 [Cryptophyta sp. CCMP2293]|mmetsp:Transcript_46786/g.111387  ORF Transcript_46786/g.111387 Transcript_46786/m.111387 type:complete len:205 (-) Transcript_46786:91-705(-)|eukprot:CAMPEP_0180201568 /NCGR_PEP_ID=MMETSP0987-20121128/6821_1 /TAXON_ID=697907 /ORGANISM="non described non described, Strain CCMP2293" /LENGTH=204 /DNA_ID=CAMNT_0022156747 /DNA_START=150 /DNA_END=764 /DNA_ORIENTATION=+
MSIPGRQSQGGHPPAHTSVPAGAASSSAVGDGTASSGVGLVDTQRGAAAGGRVPSGGAAVLGRARRVVSADRMGGTRTDPKSDTRSPLPDDEHAEHHSGDASSSDCCNESDGDDWQPPGNRPTKPKQIQPMVSLMEQRLALPAKKTLSSQSSQTTSRRKRAGADYIYPSKADNEKVVARHRKDVAAQKAAPAPISDAPDLMECP